MPESAPETQPLPGAAAPQPPPAGADAEPQEPQEPSGTWFPPQTRDQYDRMVKQTLQRQRQQLEPTLREQFLAEVQPQLDELAAIKESQKTELERLTGQLTTLTAEKLTLAAVAAAADRKDLIYAVLASREQRLPTKFWPLIEGTTPEEVQASIDDLMAEARELPGAPINGSVPPTAPPATPPAEVGLGSPASPPATLQPRPAQPLNLDEAQARLDAVRRGDPDAVAANIREHLPQVGPRR